MNTTITNVLQALNLVEVKGERNHELLLYAIRQLQSLQETQAQPSGEVK